MQHDVEHQLEETGPERRRNAAAEQARDEHDDLGAAVGNACGEVGHLEDLDEELGRQWERRGSDRGASGATGR